MALYRSLQDLAVGGAVIQAGTIFTDGNSQGGPQIVPSNWVPATPAVEPLDADAAAKFFAAGPYPPGLVRGQFSNTPVPPPACYWKAAGPNNQWQLTGIGASLGIKQMFIGQGGRLP
jgi:hypothetical protein